MSTRQATAVMVFGAVLAVGGVLMLVYAKTSGANRIRAFSVEFELSTPALVVFLAGCALVVAPFLLPKASDTSGSNDSGQTRGDGSRVAIGRETCDDGTTFELEISKPTVADDVMQVPVRLRNTSRDEQVTIIGAYLTVTDETGRALEPVDTDWNPGGQLDPGSFQQGSAHLRIDRAKPWKGLRVSTTPNGSCPLLTAVAKL